jgi:hypothetical protein
MTRGIRKADRVSVTERAGTRLSDAKVAVPDAKGRIHGYLDTDQRIYQGGGELMNFVYRAKNLISLDLQVWQFIQPYVDRIEMIDHGRNEVYEVSSRLFSQGFQVYEAGIGKRVGLPIDHWTRKDAGGFTLS